MFSTAWLWECLLVGRVVLPESADDARRLCVRAPPELRTYAPRFEQFLPPPHDDRRLTRLERADDDEADAEA